MQIDSIRAGTIADAFHRDGFVLVRQVFDRNELLALAEHVFHVRQPSPMQRARYGVDGYELFGKNSLDELTPKELLQSERVLRLHLFDPLSERAIRPAPSAERVAGGGAAMIPLRASGEPGE